MSEKNNSIVEIKIVNTDKPVVGAVQKVMNQVIILKPAAAGPITLMFGDIESVNRLANTSPADFFQKVSKAFHRLFPPALNRFPRLFPFCKCDKEEGQELLIYFPEKSPGGFTVVRPAGFF